jgi:hypothetical protein
VSGVLAIFVFSSDIVSLGLASTYRVVQIHLPSHVVEGYY